MEANYFYGKAIKEDLEQHQAKPGDMRNAASDAILRMIREHLIKTGKHPKILYLGREEMRLVGEPLRHDSHWSGIQCQYIVFGIPAFTVDTATHIMCA